jgi:hypothetical protein
MIGRRLPGMEEGFMQLKDISILICVLTLSTYRIGFAQEHSSMSASFARKIASLESTWTEGGNLAYFTKAVSLADELNALPGSQATDAVELLEVLIRKKVESVDVGVNDLSVKAKTAREILQDDSPTTSSLREEKLRALAGFLGSVRQELIADFVAKPVKMNVTPPDSGAGPRIAGMDPNAIADTAAREKYKAAILDNRRHAVLNSRQTMLRNLQAEFTQPILDLMRRTAHSDDMGLNLVQQFATTAQLTASERAVVFNTAE